MIERLGELCDRGLSCSQIGREMRVTKNAVVGAARRNGFKLSYKPVWPTKAPGPSRAAGGSRGSQLIGPTLPSLLTSTELKPLKSRAPWATQERVATALAMPSTTTWREMRRALAEMPGEPLPSSWAFREALLARGVSLRAVPVPVNVRGDHRAEDGEEPGGNIHFLRIPRPRPEPSPMMPTPRGPCRFPLWGDNERPTHLYCEAQSVVGAYCAEHGERCYDGWKDRRGAEFRFGWVGVAAE